MEQYKDLLFAISSFTEGLLMDDNYNPHKDTIRYLEHILDLSDGWTTKSFDVSIRVIERVKERAAIDLADLYLYVDSQLGRRSMPILIASNYDNVDIDYYKVVIPVIASAMPVKEALSLAPKVTDLAVSISVNRPCLWFHLYDAKDKIMEVLNNTLYELNPFSNDKDERRVSHVAILMTHKEGGHV